MTIENTNVGANSVIRVTEAVAREWLRLIAAGVIGGNIRVEPGVKIEVVKDDEDDDEPPVYGA